MIWTKSITFPNNVWKPLLITEPGYQLIFFEINHVPVPVVIVP